MYIEFILFNWSTFDIGYFINSQYLYFINHQYWWVDQPRISVRWLTLNIGQLIKPKYWSVVKLPFLVNWLTLSVSASCSCSTQNFGQLINSNIGQLISPQCQSVDSPPISVSSSTTNKSVDQLQILISWSTPAIGQLINCQFLPAVAIFLAILGGINWPILEVDQLINNGS